MSRSADDDIERMNAEREREARMKTFADTAGRAWELAINVDTIKRVRDLAKVDLLGIVDTEADVAGKLAGDVVLLCDVLFAAIKPQADQQKVSDTDFGRAMSGETLDAASTALVEELIDFFPFRRREALRRIWERVLATSAEAATPDQPEAGSSTSTGSAGSLPASSASPPAG